MCFCREIYSVKADTSELTSIKIKCSKAVYLESEPVWIEYDVNINKDIEIIREPGEFGCNPRLKLIHENGDTVDYQIGCSDWAYLGNLPHPEHYFFTYDLLQIYDVFEDFPHSPLANKHKILPGKYRFKSVLYLVMSNKGYPHDSEGEIKAYPIYSNEIQFEVINPEGEELSAQKNMISIFDNYTNKINNVENNLDKRFEWYYYKFNEFKNLYPNSVYLNKVEDEMIITGYFTNGIFRDTMYNYLISVIGENPSNYFNKDYLGLINIALKKQEKTFQDSMKPVSNTYCNTLLQKLIDNYIAEMNCEDLLNAKIKKRQKE